VFISGRNFQQLITKQKFENIDYSVEANLYGIDLDVNDDSLLLSLSSYLSNDKAVYLNELIESEENVNNCGTSTNPCKLVMYCISFLCVLKLLSIYFYYKNVFFPKFSSFFVIDILERDIASLAIH
jgi:hypothetical protein